MAAFRSTVTVSRPSEQSIENAYRSLPVTPHHYEVESFTFCESSRSRHELARDINCNTPACERSADTIDQLRDTMVILLALLSCESAILLRQHQQIGDAVIRFAQKQQGDLVAVHDAIDKGSMLARSGTCMDKRALWSGIQGSL